MTKIVLITAAFGDGHKQVARALQEEFEARGVEIITVDPFRVARPRFARLNEGLYEWITRYVPFLYGLSYRFTQNLRSDHWFWNVLIVFSKSALVKVVHEQAPDGVLQLFPDFTLQSLGTHGNNPFIGVVLTDYSVHGRWFQSNVDTYFLPHGMLVESAQRLMSPKSAAVVSGIPVRQSIRLTPPSPPTGSKHPYIVFSTGGRGIFTDLEPAISAVRKKFPNYDVYIMCGRNEQMKANVERIAAALSSLDSQIFALPFVDNVGAWFHYAEFALIKSGGITVTECFVTTCPVIAYRPQPGQEADNAAFVEQIGAGYVACNERELEIVLQKMVQAVQRDSLRDACSRSAIPDAAGRVADYVLQQIERR